MSFHLQVDESCRLVELRYEGKLDTETMLQALRSVHEKVTFGPIRYGISDFRGTSLEIDKTEFPLFIAAKDPNIFGGAKWAFLIDSPRETALGMVYTRLKEHVHEFEIFSTREAALEWLQLPEAEESSES